MLDRKFLLNNADLVAENCRRRGAACDIDALVALEKRRAGQLQAVFLGGDSLGDSSGLLVAGHDHLLVVNIYLADARGQTGSRFVCCHAQVQAIMEQRNIEHLENDKLRNGCPLWTELGSKLDSQGLDRDQWAKRHDDRRAEAVKIAGEQAKNPGCGQTQSVLF